MRSAEELESYFKDVGRIRQDIPEYDNDSGYWTGGTCNWGANHNLKQDCQTLTRGLGKLESLENISRTLKNTTSKNEFDAKKANYLTKCDEVIRGLTPNYGAHSSIFGICIIWSDNNMNTHIQQIIDETKREIGNVRSALSNETYQWVEELNRIDLEIRKIDQRMEDNKRRAMNEKDPIKRAKFIELIEEDGKLMIQKTSEKAKIEKRLNFDAKSYVNNIIEAMKKVIEDKHKPSSGSGNKGNRTPRSVKNPKSSNDDSDSEPPYISKTIKSKRTPNKKENQNNQQQLVIFASIIFLAIFFLINQKEEQPIKYHDY